MRKKPLIYPLADYIRQKFVETLGDRANQAECWKWPKCTPEGYPYIYFDGGTYSASEVSYLLYIGPLPPGLQALRTCGNHWCVNPKHLKADRPNATREDTLAERFFTKTVPGTRIKASLEKPCLLWKPAIKRWTYGKVHIRGDRIPASHVAWFIATGEEVPTDELIMHICDQPPCVEISHLKRGTTAENIQDRVEKGRTAAGENHGTHTKPESVRKGTKHGMAVFSEEEVVLIRRTYDAYPGVVGIIEWLTKHLKKKRYAVWCIAKRKTWKDVLDDALPDISPIPLAELRRFAKVWPTGEKHKLSKISNREVREIRLLASQNVGVRGATAALAARYGVSRRLIRAFVSREKRADVHDDFEELGDVTPLFKP